MQVVTGLAVVGAVPLTVGVVGWITGFCMGMVDHGRWHAWAQACQTLMLAGLACGLVLLILAVLWRGRPSVPGYPEPPRQRAYPAPPERLSTDGADRRWSR
jgi:hypothetical protein